MRLHHVAFAALATLLLAGCVASTSSPDAPKAPATEQEQAASQPDSPVSTAPVPNPQAPAVKLPQTMESKPVASASSPSRSCKIDSDCAVKDVGNCCGAYPMCVGKNARTDPAAVRAQCAKNGMAAVCGFQEVSGCQCVKGQCENLGNGAAVM